MENIEINNNVKLDDIHDNKTWIHGNSKENINITLFLITINGHQLKYSLDAINKLKLDVPIIVNVIMNVYPTNKAYNEMRLRCKTNYFIQNDEDMELYPNAIIKISKNIKKKLINNYLNIYYLIDEYLGISKPPVILGLKIYNNNIMKKYPTYQNGTLNISSVDKKWHEQVEKDGYKSCTIFTPIGYHGRKRLNFDLLLRYSKMIKSLLDNNINENRSDKLKILRPINKIENFNKKYISLVNHFLKLGYNYETFIKNNNILISKIKYISIKNLRMYNIKEDFIKIDPNNDYTFDESKLQLFDNISLKDYFTEIKNLYCIVGIINSLFGNYKYSAKDYPYDIDKYFINFFKLNICIECDSEKYKEIIINFFKSYNFDQQFINLSFEKKDNYNLYLTTNESKIQNVFKIDVNDNNILNIEELMKFNLKFFY